MKLIKTLRSLKNQLQTSLQNKEVQQQIITFLFVIMCASLVWFGGPHLQVANFYPFVTVEKRIYVILFLFLLWILKFLLFDIDLPNPFATKDLRTRNKLLALQKRFRGALSFLKKTALNKNQPDIKLNQLPWYLLIGPTNSGKSTLLTHAGVHYILHRKLSDKNTTEIKPSEHCDWWVTKDATIIDVPGSYLTLHRTKPKPSQKEISNPVIWRFLLQLIKRTQGRNGLHGIIITLPFSEMIQKYDPKKYQFLLRHLFQRLYELKKLFPQPIACYVLLTKCDLIPGFQAFFNDLSHEETSQAFGITLDHKIEENSADIFSERFNQLIKNLNKQLIARLHQERNPFTRPYIKDFPLQMERLKEFIHDFIKKLSSTNFDFSLKGVYLTSALQPETKDASNVINEETNNTQKSLLVLKSPVITSRAYFIKQFFSQALTLPKTMHHYQSVGRVKKFTVYAFSLSIILVTALFLAQDFQIGTHQTYSIERQLQNYRLIMETTPPSGRLLVTINLLNSIEDSIKAAETKFSIVRLTSFYSKKSDENASLIYQEGLKNVLLPEIKFYLEDYLSHPLNQQTEQLYRALKAYMMLGSTEYFDAMYVINILDEIFPHATNLNFKHQAHKLYSFALNSLWQPLILNIDVIEQTRKFLRAVPSVQLSYLILKNMNNNNLLQPVNLGLHTEDMPFESLSVKNHIPKMYTANYFANIISQEVTIAGEEATYGNWVLGEKNSNLKRSSLASPLIDQLRIVYMNHYIDEWENLLNDIKIILPKNLKETDQLIVNLIKEESPLIQLLQTLHDNTFFEPIISSSFKLNNIGLLIAKIQQPENLLNSVLISLKNVHLYMQQILNSSDVKKAAFAAVTKRINQPDHDVLKELRLIAEKSPQPLKQWFNTIADQTWHYLMKEAANYIDISWQNNVLKFYQSEIRDHYPFAKNNEQEVELKQFSQFFGSSGIFMDFYKFYLQDFIDTSTDAWKWKKIENITLPFSSENLQHIHEAYNIHKQFFPQEDDHPLLQFSLKAYEFGKQIKLVKLNINEKQIIDHRNDHANIHNFVWPNLNKARITSLQVVLLNQKIINRNYPGDWGWFRLIQQAFNSALNNKEILLNLSLNKQPVKYLLISENQQYPFLPENLLKFNLPEKLG